MTPLRLILVLLVVLADSAGAAESVGRVLIVQGKADLLRAGRPLGLTTGTPLELGDLVRVGAESSVQLRMSDSSLIALRANSAFLIEGYRYSEAQAEDISVFNLLKGGLRTITGYVGKHNPKGYALHVESATIGIRGTNLSALYCNGDCFNQDGSRAPDGAYGGVTEGKIVVSNKSGEVEFQKDEYFYVASADSPPARLLAPPSFLPDQLDGIVRAGSSAQVAAGTPSGASPPVQAAAANTSSGTGGNTSTDALSPAAGTSSSYSARASATGGVGGAQDASAVANASEETSSAIALTTSPLPTVVGVAIAALAVPVSYTPSATPAVQTGNVPITSTESFSEVVVGATTVSTLAPCSGACTTTVTGTSQGLTAFTFSNANVQFPAGTSAAYIQVQSESQLAAFTNATSYTVSANLSEGLSSGTETYSKTASTDTGSYTTADGQTVYWGRYQSSDVTTGAPAGSSNSTTEYTHWLVAPATLALPTSGVFTYSAVGGTHPTDAAGNAGVVNNPGAWTVNFANDTFVSAAPVVWTMPKGVSYTLDVTQPQQYTITALGSNTTQIPSGGSETRAGSAVNVVNVTNFTTCSGACAVTYSQVQPLIGNRFLSLGITTNATTSAGQQTTAQLRVYGR